MNIFYRKTMMLLLVVVSIMTLPNTLKAQTPDNTSYFVNTAPIPPIIWDSSYQIIVDTAMHNFNPNGFGPTNTLVETYAYNSPQAYDMGYGNTMTVLGPTIRWWHKSNLTPQVTNNLTDVTTLHWHGAHVPPEADGGPHQTIQPGDTWSPSFEVKDNFATMWYHPHPMDLTYEQVQMGLAGMIIVDDDWGTNNPQRPTQDSLPYLYGWNDYPVIVQTKQFIDDNGTLVINDTLGYKKDYEYLVNGVMHPVLHVQNDFARLRLLNGDGKFTFNLGIGHRDYSPFVNTGKNRQGFFLVATDAGFVDSTYNLNTIMMAPGERNEIVLDLQGIPAGDTLFIYNKVSDLPAGTIGDAATTDGFAKDQMICKIVITQRIILAPATHWETFTPWPSEAPATSTADRHRVKTFKKSTPIDPITGQPYSGGDIYNIDDTLMNMMFINDVVRIGDTEIWTIENTTSVAHPFHIHDIHFWVTEATDASGNPIDKDAYPWIFAGPKDNVLVEPGWTLSFITTFNDYAVYDANSFDSSYMYHCHILPHEDRGMMGQFVVWDTTGIPYVNTDELAVPTQTMTLFPNPNNTNFVYIKGTSNERSMVRIYDIQGRLVQEGWLPPMSGTGAVPISNIDSGMYLLEWETAEGRATDKLIIQR